MKAISKAEQKEVYLSVIKELVKERDKWEERYKHPLPKGWKFPDEISTQIKSNETKVK